MSGGASAAAAVNKAGDEDQRPVCEYKEACYRLNPHHLRAKRHVHLEKLLITFPNDLEQQNMGDGERYRKQLEVLREIKREEEREAAERIQEMSSSADPILLTSATDSQKWPWRTRRDEQSETAGDAEEEEDFFSRQQQQPDNLPNNPSERSLDLPFTRRSFEQLFLGGSRDKEKRNV